MENERVSASGKNLRVSLGGYFMTVIFNFITRRIFLSMLGSEYTGFSGLCGHVLNFLSLLEPGFDAACVFCLYRPLAYGNRELAGAIMAYIKRVYRIVGTLTAVVGLALLPVVFGLSDGKVESGYALAVYLLSLFEMSLSYFISHRRILPISDQKSYTVTGYSCGIFIFSRLVQLAVLLGSHSYIGYLAAGIVAQIPGEMLLYRRIGKMYPYIYMHHEKLPEKDRRDIISKVRSLFFTRAGAILCGSVDNMAVFTFLGLHAGALYSNYTMLSGTCLTFISIAAGSASASVGNLGVTTGRERMKKVYSTALFAIFMLAGFFAQSLFFTYPLIIDIWVGSDMILGKGTTALFCLLMFVNAIRRPTAVFIDALGLFDKEKYKTIIEAGITLIMICVLAPRLGISGVIAGQLTGIICFSFFYEPYILFKYGFRDKMKEFFLRLLKYLFAFLLSMAMSWVLCRCTQDLFTVGREILLRIAICAASTISVFSILFFDSDMLSETIRYSRKMLGRQRQ